MAKKFKFKLEVVLQERKRKEDKLLQEWTLARRLLAEMVDAKRLLVKRLNEVIDDGSRLGASPQNTSGEFYMLELFFAGQKKRIEWKGQEIERAEKLTEKKRLEYVAATQKRKVMEKLKEEQEKKYKEELRKRELRQLDDIYVMRAQAEGIGGPSYSKEIGYDE